jgi:transcriptional regulator with XRE-family HTH domain
MSNVMGTKIKDLSKQQNITQKELAEKVGITEATLSRYITGEREPKAETLSKIAKELNTTSEELLGNEVLKLNDADLITTFATVFGVSTISPMLGLVYGAICMNKVLKSENKKIKARELIEKQNAKAQSEINRYKVLACGALFNAMINNGLSFSPIQTDENNMYEPDLKVNINKSKFKEWWFIYWDSSFKSENLGNCTSKEIANYILSRLIMITPDKTRMLSIVVNDPDIFEELKGLKEGISYKGNLSVLHLQNSDAKIVNEAEIASYDDGMIDILPKLLKSEN